MKYWLEVSAEKQEKRFRERAEDPTKRWKLSPIDLKARDHYDDYTGARDDMFARTDIPEAPWWVVDADSQKRARLNVMAHLLELLPYRREDDAARTAEAQAQGARRAHPGRRQGGAGALLRSSSAIPPGASSPSTTPKRACIAASCAMTLGSVSRERGQRPERRSGWIRSSSAIPGHVATASAAAQRRPGDAAPGRRRRRTPRRRRRR